MKTIDENTIQSYQNHIYTQEKSKNTIDKYIRDIRTFTAWLQTQEQKDITKKTHRSSGQKNRKTSGKSN